MGPTSSIGNYLIERLYTEGVRHIFGVPGDYVLNFFEMLTNSKMIVVNTCDEQGAGFAADAYARLKGLGVVCVTYGVGGLKVVNTTAEAFAEKSPVVVISGAPGIMERGKDLLLHHKVRHFDTQKRVFDQITVASVVLDDPQTARAEINMAVSSAIRYKRPVYIELPRDMITKPIIGHYTGPQVELGKSDPTALKEAVEEATGMINAAKKPVIIAGVEIHRFGLKKQLVELVNKTNIPVATTILSKSVVNALHPMNIGVYGDKVGHESVRQYVESSDCLIMLGVFMTDIDLGMFTARIGQGKVVDATSERVSIRHHHYENILLQDFMRALIRSEISPPVPSSKNMAPHLHYLRASPPSKGKRITVKYLFEYLDSFLTDKMIVLADVGDALFAGTDLSIVGNTEFLSPAYYASLGFSVPASIGAKLAKPDLRPVVLVGDGAFQMTGMELSTALRYHINPIVIVLNNQGYVTERLLLDGPFNNLQVWEYSMIPKVLGGGRGFVVETEDQLEEALHAAKHYIEEFSILDVRLDPSDKSPALQRLTSSLAKKVKK